MECVECVEWVTLVTDIILAVVMVIVGGVVMYFRRNALSPIVNRATMEPSVSRLMTEADNTVSASQSDDSAVAVTDPTSIQQELMDSGSYYSSSKPVHGWTPKSLWESPAARRFQEDVISSCESTQTGTLYLMEECFKLWILCCYVPKVFCYYFSLRDSIFNF